MTDAELMHALRDCYVDRKNVVDAGLIAAAHLTPDATAPGHGIAGVPLRYHAHIALLSPGLDEALNSQLAAQIENRLFGLEAVSAVTVQLLPPLFPIL